MHRSVSLEDFEPRKVPEELKKLIPQILYNLYDIAVKWGRPNKRGIVSLPLFDKKNRGFLLSTYPAAKTMFLCKPKPNADSGFFIIETRKGFQVIWDKRISLREAIKTIKWIDGLAKKKEKNDPLIDPKNGGRKQLPYFLEPEDFHFSVSQVFQRKTDLFLVPPYVLKGEKNLLTQFDQPELLAVIEIGEGFRAIVLKESIGLFKTRAIVLLDMLSCQEKSLKQLTAQEIAVLQKIMKSITPDSPETN